MAAFCYPCAKREPLLLAVGGRTPIGKTAVITSS